LHLCNLQISRELRSGGAGARKKRSYYRGVARGGMTRGGVATTTSHRSSTFINSFNVNQINIFCCSQVLFPARGRDKHLLKNEELVVA
jgi:hypothetical protein